MKIDLSSAPSSMEQAAAAWSARAPVSAPVRSRPSAALPPRRRHRPFPDSADKGGPGFFGGNPAQEGHRQAAEAKHDAMRAMARGVPEPKFYAQYMSEREVTELRGAEWAGNSWVYRAAIEPDLLARFRQIGLAYLEDRVLTRFACAVRRVLVEDDV